MRSSALITCVVAGVKYLIHPQKLGTIDATIDADALIPVTLLTTKQIFDEDVETLLRLYDMYDDVFIPEFGAVLVEKVPANTTDRQLSTDGNAEEHYRFADDSNIRSLELLPSGPYFLYGPNLYQAWRLYDDSLDAFTTGIIPEDVDSPERFRPLTSLGLSALHKAIAVPSQLYHPPPGASGPAKPLSGLRIAVSDAVAIDGIPRTMSSRAWMETHPTRPKGSAKLVQDLVSMGAVIVGKTKTSQLTASRDWIDVPAPFSPRGDQYQQPEGSSAGASASLTGYEWLLHVIADDDRGDLLGLASQEGFFALRPSSKVLPDKGLKLASQAFSGLSLSARLLDQVLSLAQALIGPKEPLEGHITKLIRLIDLEEGFSGTEKTLYEGFVQAMENQLGVKSQPINLTREWSDSSTGKDKDLGAFVNESSILTFCHQFFREFAEFRKDYEKSQERQPFIEPTIRHLWHIGANTTEGEIEMAEESLQDFRDWFQEHILPKDSKAAIVLPNTLPTVVYRDEPLPLPKRHDLLSPNGVAALLGFPSLTAPFAQLPFESRITNNDEYRPISASVIGPHGSDIALIELVQKTYRFAQWRDLVDTGKLAFPLGDNARNVDDSKGACAQIHHPNYPEDRKTTLESWANPEL